MPSRNAVVPRINEKLGSTTSRRSKTNRSKLVPPKRSRSSLLQRVDRPTKNAESPSSKAVSDFLWMMDTFYCQVELPF